MRLQWIEYKFHDSFCTSREVTPYKHLITLRGSDQVKLIDARY